jgi:hypothetical protein
MSIAKFYFSLDRFPIVPDAWTGILRGKPLSRVRFYLDLGSPRVVPVQASQTSNNLWVSIFHVDGQNGSTSLQKKVSCNGLRFKYNLL